MKGNLRLKELVPVAGWGAPGMKSEHTLGSWAALQCPQALWQSPSAACPDSGCELQVQQMTKWAVGFCSCSSVKDTAGQNMARIRQDQGTAWQEAHEPRGHLWSVSRDCGEAHNPAKDGGGLQAGKASRLRGRVSAGEAESEQMG